MAFFLFFFLCKSLWLQSRFFNPVIVLRGWWWSPWCVGGKKDEDAPQNPSDNVNLSSSQQQQQQQQQAVFSEGLREHSCPYFTSSRSVLKAARWALLDSLCTKAPVDPRRLNPAASDAHPADVVVFTSLASSHQAVLGSPRLNELRSALGCSDESARCSSLFFSFFYEARFIL